MQHLADNSLSRPSTKQQIIEFGIGKQGNIFLTEGWGVPEDEFLWSEGPFSTIVVPHNRQYSKASLSMWGYAPLNSEKQRVLIFVNGLLLSTAEIDAKTIIDLEIEMLNASDFLKFQFYIPTTKSPKTAENSDDSRRLGIALANLVLS